MTDPCLTAERVLAYLLAHPGSRISHISRDLHITVKRVKSSIEILDEDCVRVDRYWYYIRGWVETLPDKPKTGGTYLTTPARKNAVRGA